ncbi:MAG: hypothetical protein ABI563_13085 [Specibacter sp.]
MGNQWWINVFVVLILVLTAGTLAAGCVLLRAMTGTRGWNTYLGAVGVAILGVIGAQARIYRLAGVSGESWEGTHQLSDEAEVYLSMYLNSPLLCLAVIFVGGVLLYFLGKTAARDRAAAQPSPPPPVYDAVVAPKRHW